MLTPKLAETLLRWLLIANGVMTLFALPAVFFPTSVMDMFHQQLMQAPLPAGPIVQYLARSVSALYAAFGSLTLVIAWDLRRFAPLVTWWGIVAILFGVILLGVDMNAPMPAHWTWGEVPYTVITGLLVLVLQRQMLRHQDRESP
jgi:CHASE2 domain-containing sensor protein